MTPRPWHQTAEIALRKIAHPLQDAAELSQGFLMLSIDSKLFVSALQIKCPSNQYKFSTRRGIRQSNQHMGGQLVYRFHPQLFAKSHSLVHTGNSEVVDESKFATLLDWKALCDVNFP